MEKKSRFRAPNFTPSEILLLCEIVGKYQHIIENRKTDSVNLQQKKNAWFEVMNEFNASTTGCYRTAEGLHQNYKNLKKKIKKDASEEKTDIPGETSSPIDDKEVLEKVKALVGPVLDGVYPVYNGDSSLAVPQNELPIEFHNIESGCPKLEDLDMEESQGDVDNKDSLTYFSDNRANLKKKPHHLLIRKRKSETQCRLAGSDKFKLLATEKKELLELQKELVKTQLQEQHEQAEHNRMLRAMEMEDAKKKYMHNEKIREMEMKEMKRRNMFNEKMRQF